MVKVLARAGPGDARQAFLARVAAYADQPTPTNGLRVEAALRALFEDSQSAEAPGP